MKEQKKKRHIEGMDALRGFAILEVVLYHVMPGRFPRSQYVFSTVRISDL